MPPTDCEEAALETVISGFRDHKIVMQSFLTHDGAPTADRIGERKFDIFNLLEMEQDTPLL
jgi:hypothetical protein